MSSGPPPSAVAEVVAASAAADGVHPFEHIPEGSAPDGAPEDGTPAGSAAFGVERDGRLAAVAVLVAGTVTHIGVATHPDMRGRGAGAEVAAMAVHAADAGGPRRIDMWIPGVGARPAADAIAYRLDFALTRRLMRLEIELDAALLAPASTAWPDGYGLDVMDDADVEEVVAVNNRAFAWHEDQGHWSADALRRRLGEQWVDRAGFLVARGPGGIAGFCWTKLHGGANAVGEIYVICADPAHAGRGLGRALTLAGLRHLSASVPSAMLYVDDGNLPARRTYRRIGFRLARVDARYTRDRAMAAFGGLRGAFG